MNDREGQGDSGAAAVDAFEYDLIRHAFNARQLCRVDAERMGRPHQVKFANQVLRERFDCYEEILERYRRFQRDNI